MKTTLTSTSIFEYSTSSGALARALAGAPPPHPCQCASDYLQQTTDVGRACARPRGGSAPTPLLVRLWLCGATRSPCAPPCAPLPRFARSGCVVGACGVRPRRGALPPSRRFPLPALAPLGLCARSLRSPPLPPCGLCPSLAMLARARFLASARFAARLRPLLCPLSRSRALRAPSVGAPRC